MENEELLKAVEVIKTAILKSQYNAGKAVNAEELSLYYGIGRYISANSRKGKWGTGAIESISEQLQKNMPGLRGFSATNMKRMRTFYEEWSELEVKSSVMTDEIESKSSFATDDLKNENIVPLKITKYENFPIMDFLKISFTHHYEIIVHSKNFEERCFYIKLVANQFLTVEKLKKEFKLDTYHNQTALPNNFQKTITDSKMALKAIKTFKDSYFLDFMNTEELFSGDDELDEKVLENEIVNNIKKFIMTFGKDFSFVGNQYHLEVAGHDHYSDLVFYNRELQALVAVELKVGKFKPIYLGQLQLYLQMLDDFVKKPHENPSIGIVLCQNADKPYVEYCIKSYDKPMGVATYKTSADMSDELKKALPPVEELIKLLEKSK